MAKQELVIMIGGEAGQGLVTIGEVLAKALVDQGFHMVVTQDYMSRIRGGHNTFTIRMASHEIQAPAEGIDLLVALNQETLDLHDEELHDGALVVAGEGLTCGMHTCFNVPYDDLADKRYTNTVALGVCGYLLGLDLDRLGDSLAKHLKKLSDEVIQENRTALKKAADFAKDNAPEFDGLEKGDGGEGRVMLGGNQAIALGALAGGLKFLSFYPMTPSTSIALTVIAHADKMGVVYEQAEDEIAAINMAVGAAYAGAPAMVTTSGGGFALMGEGVSLAGMTETPVVVAVVQRPGPATGLPTRTEQGDLELVLHAGHGEFPRAIFAPGTIDQCFQAGYAALHLAEDAQTPVFILGDQYLADSYRAVHPPSLDGLEPVSPGDAEAGQDADYQRYALTDSGVSPRALPGDGPGLVVADSDEHTPDGHITEDLGVRVEMNNKRLRKMDLIRQRVEPPEFDGPEDPELLLVCWGSARGAVWEAAQRLRQGNRTVATCHFSQVWPLITEHYWDRFDRAGRVVMVEGNATGQLANLIRRESGFKVHRLVTRYDGLPLTAGYIVDALES